MTTPPIQLIVGLGNPGSDYDRTRHNAGADFVSELANGLIITWRLPVACFLL